MWYSAVRIVFLFVVLIYVTTALETNQQLIQLHVVSRHGDRSPEAGRIIKIDPASNVSYWPMGWGALTNVGKVRAYNLGKFLRLHYSDILRNISFNTSSVYIRSSDKDRTLMTAQLINAGLFAPEPNEIWNKDLLWQPVPVHTQPLDGDWLSAVPLCPTGEKDLHESVDRANVLIHEKYPFLKSYLENCTGEAYYRFLLLKVYNNLQSQLNANYSLLPCIKELYPEPLTTATGMIWKYGFSASHYLRMRAGPMLEDIIVHMQQMVNKTSNVEFYLYSTHDMNIVTLLNALQVMELIPTPYCATVIFELIEDVTDHTYYVNVLYSNTTDIEFSEDFHILNISGCEQLCKLETFIQLMQPLIPQDWKAECFPDEKELSMDITDVILGIICIVLIITVIVLALKLRRRKGQHVVLGIGNLSN